MSLGNDLKYQYGRLNIFERIIAINVVVFIICVLLNFLVPSFLSWFEFPASLGKFISQPWSIITYAFLHYNLWHLFFNMIWLYFIGRLFVNLFNTKLGLNVYFLGILFGGLFFTLGYNVFPGFFNKGAMLIGASAAVRALMIFLCAYMPNMEVRFFTFNIRLWYIGVAIVILDILGLFGGNPGGNLAHLGGAFLGYLYAIQLQKGTDIGKGFERFMDTIFNLFKKSSGTSRMKTVHRSKTKKYAGHSEQEFNEYNKQKQIDLILDKISKSGYDSLSEEEKEFLFKTGK